MIDQMDRIKKRAGGIALLCVIFLCASLWPAGVFAGETEAAENTVVRTENTAAETEKTAVSPTANSPTVLTVVDYDTGSTKKEYTMQDFARLGIAGTYPIADGNADGLVFQKISARSQSPVMPDTWYGVTGVTVEWLLRDLGIWDTFTEITFISSDLQSYSMTKADIEDPEEYYYAGSDGRQAKVYPMLGLWYTEVTGIYADPAMPDVDETGLTESAPRLFFGQNSWQEVNQGGFLKDIVTVVADFPPDDLYHIPPVISGVPEDIYIRQGGRFDWPSGITATDAYGYSVPVTRSVLSEDGTKDYVDVNTPGTYTITYRAEDSRGNAATETLLVHVYEAFVQQGIYDVTIQDGSGYTVKDGSPAELTVDEGQSGRLSFSVTVTPQKRYGSQQTVLFVQYRGDRMIGLSSQTLSVGSAKTLSGSFSVSGGDSVRVFVLNAFDSQRGSASSLLNGM